MTRRIDTHARARRLLGLLPHLRKGATIPVADLASAVGCTPAEVVDDLATLTMCGVPPFTPFDMIDLDIDGDVVTVYLDPPGLDRPLRLTIGEARSLGAALEIVGYGADSPLRVKLAEISTASIVAEDLELTIRTGTAPGGAAEVYATLAAAAEDHRKLRIVYYTGSTGRESARVIHPWALVQSLGAWYLVAMCETAGQERVFRLDRIREIEPVDESFTSPVTFSGSVTPDLSALGVAEVRFVAGAPLPDDHAWPGIVLEAQPDGSTLARVPYQTTSWLARRVVAYLGEAEVISPDAVRTAVRALAAEELSTAQHA